MPTPTRRAFVKTYFQFDIREDALPDPGPGEVLLEIAACAVCGTDLSIAAKTAGDWQSLGHEISAVVREVGPDVQRVAVGDRVALDTSAPCGSCAKCQAGRLVECQRPASYWGRTMGFADYMLAPWQLVFPVGDLSARHACLLEPMGVSLDLVDVADVEADSRVLIIGPGPLGLLAIPDCVRRGASRIWMAGRSHSVARLAAAEALGAEVIHVDKTPLDDYDWGGEAPDRILVVAPPDQIPIAARVGARSAIISYIGIAFDDTGTIPFDFDAFHFKRMQLRSSMHGPATRSLDSLEILQSGCFDPDLIISEEFQLPDLADAMARNRDDKTHAKKLVMTRPETGW